MIFWRILGSKQHKNSNSHLKCVSVNNDRIYILRWAIPLRSWPAFSAHLWTVLERNHSEKHLVLVRGLPSFWYLQLQLKWTDDWKNTIYLPHHNRHHLTENLTYYLEIQSQFCLPTQTHRLPGCRDLCPAFLETQREIGQSKQSWGLGICIWKP